MMSQRPSPWPTGWSYSARAGSPSTLPSICPGRGARLPIPSPPPCRRVYSTKSDAHPPCGREASAVKKEAFSMAELTIVGISGNLTRPSKTRVLVGEILRHAASLMDANTELYDIVDAGPELGAVVHRAHAAAAPDRVLSAIERA